MARRGTADGMTPPPTTWLCSHVSRGVERCAHRMASAFAPRAAGFRRCRYPLALAVTLACAQAHGHADDDARIAALSLRIEQHPEDASLLRARARAQRLAGRPKEALGDLSRAESMGPEPAEHVLERALSRRALDDPRALEDLDAFLASGVDHAQARVARAQVLARRGDVEAALADYDLAFQLDPVPDIDLARGELAAANGATARAIAGHEAALRVLGPVPSLQRVLVRRLLDTGAAERALALCSTAGAGPELRLLRGEAFARLGDAEAARAARREALAEIDQALAHRPSDLLRVERVRALLAAGRRAEARRELDRVLATSPGLRDAQELSREMSAARVSPNPPSSSPPGAP